MTARRGLPAEAFDTLPRLAVTLTDESTWLTRFDPCGKPTSTYPVAPDAVAAAFGTLRVSSGFLPEGMLFWQKASGAHQLAVWLPPRRRALLLSNGRREETVDVPLPGFVFAGAGTNYFVFACPQRPETARAPLFHAPLPNVYDYDGHICAGSVKFPRCGPETIHQAAELFFQSAFNSDLAHEKVLGESNALTFLRSLHRARTFPRARLVLSPVTILQLMERH